MRLAEAGRRGEGLTAIEEAVTIYRRLAAANPAAYEPALAMSLNNLSVRLGEAGRRGEGLTAIEEAVTIYRRLAAANPAAYEPALASSLNNLSIDLAEAGRRGEGLTAIEEAVTIYRRLAAANPAAYEPDLAMSLNNLSSAWPKPAAAAKRKLLASKRPGSETRSSPRLLTRKLVAYAARRIAWRPSIGPIHRIHRHEHRPHRPRLRVHPVRLLHCLAIDAGAPRNCRTCSIRWQGPITPINSGTPHRRGPHEHSNCSRRGRRNDRSRVDGLRIQRR